MSAYCSLIANFGLGGGNVAVVVGEINGELSLEFAARSLARSRILAKA